jgi:hypothetical protein
LAYALSGEAWCEPSASTKSPVRLDLVLTSPRFGIWYELTSRQGAVVGAGRTSGDSDGDDADGDRPCGTATPLG